MTIKVISSLSNDFSKRDIQMDEFKNIYGFIKSKAINSMGPYLVTALDPGKVEVRVKVNGKEILSTSTKDIRFTIAETISYLSSQGEGITAGQIVGTETMSGGSLFELELPLLQMGDVVEIVANQGLGTLINKIN